MIKFNRISKLQFKNLEIQIIQLVAVVGRYVHAYSNLPSQTIISSKENASVITLRNGKQLKELPKGSKNFKSKDKSIQGVHKRDGETAP